MSNEGALLLEAFPLPPSFIPPSPSPNGALTFNPPPSRPPASPLPPVPGPSRFSWQDAHRILAREDSISEVSMNDLPDDDDDDDDELKAIAAATQAAVATQAKRRASSSSWRSSFAERTPRPIALSQSTSAIRTVRSGSPDIPDIISQTPRARRSASTTFSVRSTSTSRPPSASRRRSSPIDHLAYDRASTFTSASTWEENDFIDVYGDLERQLEGEGSDSDSSLDLHTPLPRLMVKHGLLSPHSKLLPKASMESLSSDDEIDPKASSISVATTKSSKSILKDSRDTPRRRVRHRDGKLLRGGIGLTTGLGWSDSEDEDAPSPLTRRISSLNLRRAASEAGSEEDKGPRLVRSVSSSGWRSTMSSGYTMPRSRLSSSSSVSSFNLPRSRASSSSTSSSYNLPPPPPPSSFNHPPVSLRGFDKAVQQGLIEDYRQPKSPTGSIVDKDKLLPSLPNPKTGSIRRPSKIQLRLDQHVRLGASSNSHSPSSYSPASNPHSPSSLSPLERKRSQSMYNGAGPRTLKLPARQVAVPVPAVPTPTPGLGLRPRTGTGMVYRNSGVPL